MATVNIRREGGNIVYDPSPILLTANDFIVFANLDPDAPHQPAPVGKPATYWFDNSLPPFVGGQPAATSPAINLSGTAGVTKTRYEGGLTPGSGTGTVTC